MTGGEHTFGMIRFLKKQVLTTISLNFELYPYADLLSVFSPFKMRYILPTMSG